MKLAKAIELSPEIVKSLRDHKFHDHADVVQLGLEALKETKRLRKYKAWFLKSELPGEDPEPATRRSLHHIKAVLESPLGKEPQNQHSGPKRL